MEKFAWKNLSTLSRDAKLTCIISIAY